jgi:hypothetical protein
MRYLLFVAIAFFLAAPTLAQTNRGTTGGGTTGGGTSSGSSGLFGQRTTGTSLRPGNRTLTGSTAGQGSVAGQTQQGTEGVGQIQGNERFQRENRAQQGFIGQNAESTQNFLSTLNAAQAQQGRAQQMNRRQDQDAVQDPNDAAGGNSRNRVMYRITRQAAFDYRRPAPTQVSNTLATRIGRLPQIRTLSNVQVELNDRTAILRGQVATAHDRVLAEKLALLEPGVSRVQNELTVGSPAPATPPAR